MAVCLFPCIRRRGRRAIVAGTARSLYAAQLQPRPYLHTAVMVEHVCVLKQFSPTCRIRHGRGRRAGVLAALPPAFRHRSVRPSGIRPPVRDRSCRAVRSPCRSRGKAPPRAEDTSVRRIVGYQPAQFDFAYHSARAVIVCVPDFALDMRPAVQHYLTRNRVSSLSKSMPLPPFIWPKLPFKTSFVSKKHHDRDKRQHQ